MICARKRFYHTHQPSAEDLPRDLDQRTKDVSTQNVASPRLQVTSLHAAASLKLRYLLHQNSLFHRSLFFDAAKNLLAF
jgi:hypothetical protein